MPERLDQQLADDAEVLRLWLKSEYYPAWLRLMEDALEDRAAVALNYPIRTQDDHFAALEAKAKYLGMREALTLVQQRINAGAKARDRMERLR